MANKKIGILTELKEVLNLEVLPRKIESFDISNLSGTNIVAGMFNFKAEPFFEAEEAAKEVPKVQF